MTTTKIGITLENEVLLELDRIRGLIPRATYINAKLKEIVMPDSLPSTTDTTATPQA